MTAATKRDIRMCHLPELVDRHEQQLFRRVHRAFCAQKDAPGHDCQGAVTFTHNSITLRCALCGDARRLIGAGSE